MPNSGGAYPARFSLKVWFWEHPQWWVAILTVVCWWVMLTSHHLPVLPSWWLMVGAMMLPMQLSQIRFIAFKSRPHGRQWSVGLFVMGHTLVWGSVALIFLLDHRIAHPWPYAASAAFAAAALWTRTPIFRSAVWKSHATRAIYTQGWPRIRSTFGHGVRVATACIVTCGPAMLACAWSHHYTPAMVLGFVASYLLKAYERPPIRAIAALYFACSVLTWPDLLAF